MTDAPKGYTRNAAGVLEMLPAWRRDRHDEAVWFKDGHGERFGCTVTVYRDGRDMTGHPCGKTAKHDPDAKGNPTHCGIHSIAAKARRRAKANAQYELERALSARRNERNNLLREAPGIIRQIADGHNDPRTLCLEWIAKSEVTQ